MEKNDYELARFEYIQRKIEFLDQNVHRYTTLFQQLTTAVLTGGVAIFVGWKKLDITAEEAQIAIYSLLGLFTILVVFLFFSIASNCYAWYDYRKEEVELINTSVGEGLRKKPTFTNFFYWQEFWFAFLILGISILIWCLTIFYIIPHITPPII